MRCSSRGFLVTAFGKGLGVNMGDCQTVEALLNGRVQDLSNPMLASFLLRYIRSLLTLSVAVVWSLRAGDQFRAGK